MITDRENLHEKNFSWYSKTELFYSYTWLVTVSLQIEFIITGPCGQNVCCAAGFKNNCLWNGVDLA